MPLNRLNITRASIFIILGLLNAIRLFGADDVETNEIRLLLAEGKSKIDLLNRLSEQYVDISNEKSLSYALNAGKLAKENGEVEAEIKAYSLAARAYENLGDNNNALNMFSEGIDLATRTGKDAQLLPLLFYKVRFHLGEMEQPDAFEALVKAYRIAHSLNDLRYSGLTEGQMSHFYFMWKDYDKAVTEITKSIANLQAIKDTAGLVEAYITLGSYHLDHRNFEPMKAAFGEAGRLAGLIGNNDQMSVVFKCNGDYYVAINDYPRGIENYKQAISLAIATGNKRLRADLLVRVGHAEFLSGRPEEELNWGRQALDLRRSTGIKSLIASSLVNVGYSHCLLKNYDSALVYANNALQTAIDASALNYQLNSYKLFIKIYTETKQYDKLSVAYRDYDKLKDSITAADKIRQLLAMRNNFETVEAEEKIDNLKKTNSNLYIYAFIVFSVLFMSLLFVLMLKYREKKLDNGKLARKEQDLIKAMSELEHGRIELQELNDTLELRVEERTAELLSEINKHELTGEKLRQNETKYKNLFNTVADAVFLVDARTGKIVESNDEAEKMYMYSSDELLSKNIVDLEAYNAKDISERQGEVGRDSVKYHVRSNGIVFPVEISSNKLDTDQFVTMSIRDISERFAFEEKLLNMYSQLKTAHTQVSRALENEQSLNNMKTNFIRTVSHEYRTPLTVILASAEILEYSLRSVADDNFKLQIAKIKNAVSRMTAMVDDVLVLDNMTGNDIVTKKEKVNPVEFVRLLIEDITGIDENKHPIEFITSESEFELLTDEKLLYHILSNLLINATKYSEKGSPVNITLYRREGNVIFTIEDKGTGISKDEVQKIYDPFHRGRNVFNTQGTGFGLTIAKKAAESLGGELRVETEENVGTKFFVVIPESV